MANHRLPKYYHLQMKPMEVIQPEHPSVTQATQRILNLIDLEAQRRIGHPELLTALTTQELKRFKRDDQILANRALDFADNTSISPDPVDGLAYYYLYHDRGVQVDPPSHAVALFAHGRPTNARIPVVPIHTERFKYMLKNFPSLPGDADPAETTEITERDRHPSDMNAEMRTEGDLPMVKLGVTSAEAFTAIRHWVYTQDTFSLVKAILGEKLARSVDLAVFSVYEPAFWSSRYAYECYMTACLSVESDSQPMSALTEGEVRVAEIKVLATTWELLNDEFWAVVLTLERMIPVALEYRHGV